MDLMNERRVNSGKHFSKGFWKNFKKHKWVVVYEKGAKNNKKSSKKSASKCNSNVNDLIKLVGNGKCLIMDEDEDEEI